MSRVAGCGSSCWGFFLSGFGGGGTVLEAEAVIAGLEDEDMAMVGKAVVILASPSTSAHSLKLRLVVMMTLVRS